MYREPALHKFSEKARFPLFYFASFLAAMHFYLVVYINSSFLAQYVGEELVGIFYITASLASIALFLSASGILRRIGNYRALILFTTIEALSLLMLGIGPAASLTPLIFIIHLAVAPLIFFNLDIFLEGSLRDETETGKVRGTFLTVLTTAFVLSPLTAGALIESSGFNAVYIISAALLFPFLSLIALSFRRFSDPLYHAITPGTLIPTVRAMWRRMNIRSIILAHLIMRVYMSWMAVYLPIYLHIHVGFSWSEIGLMLVLMFLPYFLEFPLGKIADSFLGEKELLLTGFAIMAVATMIIPFIESASFIVWTGILLFGRIGTAFTEIMSESYFFKQIDGDDTEMLSFFRLLRPASYAIAITTAVILLGFMPLQYTFFGLAAIMLLGFNYARRIVDTK